MVSICPADISSMAFTSGMARYPAPSMAAYDRPSRFSARSSASKTHEAMADVASAGSFDLKIVFK
jgi:hypothetical protein